MRPLAVFGIDYSDLKKKKFVNYHLSSSKVYINCQIDFYYTSSENIIVFATTNMRYIWPII